MLLGAHLGRSKPNLLSTKRGLLAGKGCVIAGLRRDVEEACGVISFIAVPVATEEGCEKSVPRNGPSVEELSYYLLNYSMVQSPS
jgi:hypothetical protein